jgi:hypothetical protein
MTMKPSWTAPTGRRTARRLLLALAVGVSVATTALAVDKPLGTFKDWSAMSFTEDKNTVCMMWSQPEKAEGEYKKRGEVFVFITHRPKDREMNKVSFETGYTFKESSEVRVTIDGKAYTLYTDGSTAWRKMVMEGTSSRGTDTRDTYSLSGFSAAHNAINKACKSK